MSPTSATVAASGPLTGRVTVPGDKSISHRALMFGALAEGRSRLAGLSNGDDVARTAQALAALGAPFTGTTITGGRSRLTESSSVLDVGNSGTSIRLLAGLVASLPFLTVLSGDDSLHRRPMDRVVEPLRAMGAYLDGREQGARAPLVVRGGELHGIDFTPPAASAQLKGLVLLAGLGAMGETVVREAVPTRRHTEEFLALTGADFDAGTVGDVYTVQVRSSELEPFELDVPGDPSQAAFLVVAASLVPGSALEVANVYTGPGRAGFLDVLDAMGARIERRPIGATTADLYVQYAPLHATELGGADVAGCIDEIPVLAVAAACAEGTTVFRDAGELRFKESDRIATTTAALEAVGVGTEAFEDGFAVQGVPTVRGGRVAAHGDHRIAMAFCVAGLVSADGVQVDGFEGVETSWPSFLTDLEGATCR